MTTRRQSQMKYDQRQAGQQVKARRRSCFERQENRSLHYVCAWNQWAERTPSVRQSKVIRHRVCPNCSVDNRNGHLLEQEIWEEDGNWRLLATRLCNCRRDGKLVWNKDLIGSH
jgi:hypothetical protein